jgi:hypothetical protein
MADFKKYLKVDVTPAHWVNWECWLTSKWSRRALVRERAAHLQR